MRTAMTTALAACLLSWSPAALGDPWKEESGHGRGGYSYEYKSGGCKYEYKAVPAGIKEEYKCDGWGGAVPPPTVIIHDHDEIAALPAPPPGPVYGEVYRDEQGRYCREYQTTGTIDGKPQRLYGIACLEPDGSWRFVD